MATANLAIQTHFRNLKDPRRAPRHLLLDIIIIIAVCAVICGANDWQQIATFGRQRRAWLQRFLRLPNGIPCDIQQSFIDACDKDFVGLKHDTYETRERGHGLPETGPCLTLEQGCFEWIVLRRRRLS